MHLTERNAPAVDSAADDSGARSPADPEPDQPPSPGSAAELTLDLIDAERLLDGATARRLRDLAARAVSLAAGPEARGELRIRLTRDDEMSRLHARHCDDPTTTDVLTFNHAPDRSAALDADILVCVDEASRQATSRAVAVERELLLYILHGALHCLGYDDADDASYQRMHQREGEILRAVGVGDVFAAPPRGSAS